MKRILCRSLLPGIAAAFVVAQAGAQPRPRFPGGQIPLGQAPGAPGAPGAPPAAPATPAAPPAAGGAAGAGRPGGTPAPGGGAPGAPAAGGAPGAGAPGAPGAGGAPGAPGAGGKSDTAGLSQFENGVEFEPKSPDYRVAFSLEDADLPEIVRVIGQLTGKRFIFGGKVRNIKATVYSPQKITVAEAYQAFLSILETNGLTVIPHGRFLKIVETGGIATQATPTYDTGQGAPAEDRYVTRIHRLSHVNAEEVANVLGKFKTKDGDIVVYAPGNLLIITDTGTNIRRMMQIVEDVDVGAAGDQIWIEPVHYASATEIANRVNDLFDIKSGAAKDEKGKPVVSVGAGDLHIAKLIPDDRTNSLVIVATERAYMRVLEIIKRLDVPQTGEGEIHVLPLQHADAVDLTKTLNEIITGAGGNTAAGGQAPKPATGGTTNPQSGVFEAGVKVSADKATNSIVVTSSLRDYAQLHHVIERLDLPRRQVFIDAVVLDLDINRSNNLGFSFHGADLVPTGSLGSSLLYGGLNPLSTILLPDPTTLQGMALGVRGPGLPNSSNLLGTGLTIPAFGMLINAIATSGDADVLSTPHILATDNEDAEINVGQNIPLQTNSGFAGLPSAAGGASGATGATAGLAGLGLLGAGGSGGARTDVGTKIKIKPHLNESNEVRIELTEEISEALNPQGQLGVVPITKRNATTKLIVRDQQTVIIGGLMRNRITHSVTEIPILGDIPVIGALFRQTTDAMEKSNLILILTPFIIREQSDLRTIFERKMQERQEFLDRYFVFTDRQDYNPPHDFSRTYGLLEDIRANYRGIEESRILDEATRPKEIRGHEPGQPLEMPATVHVVAAGGGAVEEKPEREHDHEGKPPSIGRTPNINIAPGQRGVTNVEK
jgi:general secretion pathway protein D